MNVNLSLEVAFLDKRSFEATYATVATDTTPRSENKDVVVNIVVGSVGGMMTVPRASTIL